jgi:arabinogalactan oligomer/maltooligosaccharide transport system substrate-binding protein
MNRFLTLLYFSERRYLMKKKVFLTFCSLAVLGLAACGGNGGGGSGGSDDSGEYSITVWCPDAAVDLTTAQLNTFAAEHADKYTFHWNIQPVSEASAAGNMATDPEAGADVYFFAQDQLARLVKTGAIQRQGGTTASEIEAMNDAGSVAASKMDDKLYAFPLTSDNGYFMYYNKDVVTDPTDMTKIIADVKAAGKQISFQLGADGGWYNASFFFAAGCTSDWVTDSDGNFTDFTDTYNSAAGLKAVAAMDELIGSGIYACSSSAADLGSNAAVVISGTWDTNAATEALGEKLGVAELPNVKIGDESKHLGSFAGYKLLGVKPQQDAKKASVCNKIGLYLTGKTCQHQRFTELGWGPSNKEAQVTDTSEVLEALKAQNVYSKVQGQFPSKWWTAAAAIGTDVFNLTSHTEADYQKILDDYTEAIEAIIEE